MTQSFVFETRYPAAILSPVSRSWRRFAASVEANRLTFHCVFTYLLFRPISSRILALYRRYMAVDGYGVYPKHWRVSCVGVRILDDGAHHFGQETPLEKLRNVAIIAHVDHGSSETLMTASRTFGFGCTNCITRELCTLFRFIYPKTRVSCPRPSKDS